ncbi:MAG: hypothetical protein EA409_05010 [Saprospirales bacterium]|jgi:hypothetical protein|nr:MAG: hypothetical protein EA409_05010 [Saprospirales bacterium]
MSFSPKVIYTILFLIYSSVVIASGPVHSIEKSEEVVYDKWTPYYDFEENLVFIDFEALDFNLLEIKVYDAYQNLLFSDRVDDLPFNSIYELDITGFEGTHFSVQLLSHTAIYPAELQLMR